MIFRAWFFLCLALPLAGATPASPSDSVISQEECARELIASALKIWPAQTVAARTLGGTYEPPYTLHYRLRSFHNVSPELAAHLALGHSGLPVLLKTAAEGNEAAYHLVPALRASVGNEDSTHYGQLLQAIAQDPVLRTHALQHQRFSGWLLGGDKDRIERFAYQPAFLPAFLAHLHSPAHQHRAAAANDLSLTLKTDEVEALARQGGLALRDPKLANTLLAFGFPSSITSETDVVLPHNQHALDIQEYLQTLVREIPFQDIQSLEQLQIQLWQDTFQGYALTVRSELRRKIPHETFPIVRIALSPLATKLQETLNLLVRARRDQAEKSYREACAQLRQAFHLSETQAAEIWSRLEQASLDPRGQTMVPAEFLIRKKMLPEILFAHLASHNLHFQSNVGGVPFLPMVVRPQQVGLVTAALQYGYLPPKSKVLEIGHRSPLLLLALKYYLPHISTLVGLEINDVLPAELKPELAKSGINLVLGNAPLEANVSREVVSNGPYNLIYGVDVLRETYGGNGRDFSPGVANSDYLKWLHSLLVPGGCLLVFNDNSAPPHFSMHGAEKAGFTIVRWGEHRPIPTGVRDLLAARDKTTGDMALFVLKKSGE